MMIKENNKLVGKNFGKKKCLDLNLSRLWQDLMSMVDGSRVLEQRQRILSRHKSSSYNKHEMGVERMTTEVNALADDERVDLEYKMAYD